jgi:hypothetical protein
MDLQLTGRMATPQEVAAATVRRRHLTSREFLDVSR